jgi:urease accessory protein
VLAAGAPGKAGWARLELGPVAGRTRLLTVEQRVPLHVGRVLYQQPDWPELAHLTLTTPTGGFVEGDRIEVSVVARAGAAAHVTSQSAARAYRCDAGDIRQMLRVEVRGDGYLEWWPDPLIPYGGTAFHQEATLEVDPAATLLFAETVLAGRLARGEAHASHRLELVSVARRIDGMALFRDTLRLEPARRRPGALGLWGGADALGTFYLLGPGVAERLEGRLAEALEEREAGSVGLTRLPNGAGLLVRALVERAEDLRWIQQRALATARRALRGRGVAAGAKY